MANDLTLAIRIRADGTAEVVSGLEHIQAATRGLNTAGRQAQEGMNSLSQGANQGSREVDGLRANLLKLGAAVGILEALRRGISSFFAAASEYETLEAQLKTVTGSAEKAKQAFAALAQEAKSSPSQVSELVSAWSQLTMRGLDNSLAALRDFQALAASTQGKTLNDAIQAVLDAAIGQGDERLAEFGIAWQKKGDEIALSFGKTRLTVANDADQIVAALRKIAQENFADAIANQSGTFRQQMSNMADSWNQLMKALADLGIFKLITTAIGWVTEAINGLSFYIKVLGEDWQMVKKIGEALWQGGGDFGAASRGDAIKQIIAERNAAVAALSAANTALVALPDVPKAVAKAHGEATEAIKKHRSALAELGVPYADLIEKASQMYGVDAKLIAAIISIESNFNASAKNIKSSATGLMQVLKGTWDWMGGDPNKRKDPWENIRVGTQYLAYLQKIARETGKDLEWVLRHYGENTDAYVNKVYRALEKYGDGKAGIDALAAAHIDAAKAAEDQAEAEARLTASLDKLWADVEQRQQAYFAGLAQQAQAAQDALLQAQDPAAYRQVMLERELALNKATTAELLLGQAAEQQGEATIRAKYATEDAIAALKMKEGWAQSVLQGFDNLWANMINGGENALETLKKTLKSWFLSLGQWLLKQAIIIPITAKLFNVSETALGGGLLGSLGGGGAEAVVDAVNQNAETVAGSVKAGTGGLNDVVKSTSGGLLDGLAGLFGGTWKILTGIFSALTTGRFAQASESLANAGSTISGGFSKITGWFGGSSIADALNGVFGTAGGSYFDGMNVVQEPGLFGGVNWGYGVAGILGGLAGSRLGGYGGMGGGLGGMLGYGLGSGLTALGAFGGPIGAVVGALLGGLLGKQFGGEEVTGGAVFWDPLQGARKAHADASTDVLELVTNLGETATKANRILRRISGLSSDAMVSMGIDTDTEGRIAATFGGQSQEGFESLSAASEWMADQMEMAMRAAIDDWNVGGFFSDMLLRVTQGMNLEEMMPVLDQFATMMPQATDALLAFNGVGGNFVGLINRLTGELEGGDILAVLEGMSAVMPTVGRLLGAVSTPIQATAVDAIQDWAESVDDVEGILVMAQDAQAGWGASLETTIWAVRNLRWENETLSESYARVKQQTELAQDAWLMLYDTVREVTGPFMLVADALAQMAGGADRLASLQSFFFENFWSDEERQTAQKLRAQARLDEFNAALFAEFGGGVSVASKAQLRAFAESMDLQSEQGQQWYIKALEIADALQTLEGDVLAEIRKGWKDFSDHLLQIIDDLRYGTANPLSAPGRFALMSTAMEQLKADYLAATGEKRLELGQQLADMLQQRLALGQEFLARSSDSYLGVYNQTMESLMALQEEAAARADGLDQYRNRLLEQIALNTGGLPQYAEGTDYVRHTGLAVVHQGERIIPAGQSSGEPGIVIHLTVNGGNSTEVERAVIRLLPRIKRELRRN